MKKAQLLIGAMSSESGKTTFTLGLLRALRNRGHRPQPFKCGPDYLDTCHHALAAGQESYNLDVFMASGEYVRELYARKSAEADVCITEGVMGLFDGYDKMKGSSAEIAALLHLPVILVVSARSTAYTIAALLSGLKHFRTDVHIAGVVFNFVGSETHYACLQQACEDVGIECLGYLPKCRDIEIPSRHLGLSIDSEYCFEDFANRIATQLEQTVNIDRLLAVASAAECPAGGYAPFGSQDSSKTMQISVARDEAFNFIYPENIRRLEEFGKVRFFSPLHDHQLPTSDFIYLPGGYPEFYLPALSENEAMKKAVFDYCQAGGHLLAECGGMMYLGEYIISCDGTFYPMCGVLPQGATMENMKLTLGYRKVVFKDEEFFGHEFHYSRIVSSGSTPALPIKVYNARNIETNTPVYRIRNAIASYVHFYWAEKNIYTIFK